jgi:hypothetical protein
MYADEGLKKALKLVNIAMLGYLGKVQAHI